MDIAEPREAGQQPLQRQQSGSAAITVGGGGRTHLWCVCASAPAYQVDKQAISSSMLMVPVKLIAYCERGPEPFMHTTPIQPVLDSLLPTTLAGDTVAVLLHVLLYQQNQLLTSQALLVPVNMLANQQPGDLPLELDVCVQATGSLLQVPTILTCQVCSFLQTSSTVQQPLLLASCKLPIMPMGGSAHELCSLYSSMLSQYKQLTATQASDPLTDSPFDSSGSSSGSSNVLNSQQTPAWHASDHVVVWSHCYEPLLHNMEQLLRVESGAPVNQVAIAQLVQYLTEQGLAKTLACMLMKVVNAGASLPPNTGDLALGNRGRPAPGPAGNTTPGALHWPDPKPRVRSGGAHKAVCWMAGQGPSHTHSPRDPHTAAGQRPSSSTPAPGITAPDDWELFSLSRENCEVLLDVLKTHSSCQTAPVASTSQRMHKTTTSEHFRSFSKLMLSRRSTALGADMDTPASTSTELRPDPQVVHVYEGLGSSPEVSAGNNVQGLDDKQQEEVVQQTTQLPDSLFQPRRRVPGAVKVHYTKMPPTKQDSTASTSAQQGGNRAAVRPAVPLHPATSVAAAAAAGSADLDSSTAINTGCVPGLASHTSSGLNLHLYTISDADTRISAEMLLAGDMTHTSMAYNTWHPEQTFIASIPAKLPSRSAPTTKEALAMQQGRDMCVLMPYHEGSTWPQRPSGCSDHEDARCIVTAAHVATRDNTPQTHMQQCCDHADTQEYAPGSAISTVAPLEVDEASRVGAAPSGTPAQGHVWRATAPAVRPPLPPCTSDQRAANQTKLGPIPAVHHWATGSASGVCRRYASDLGHASAPYLSTCSSLYLDGQLPDDGALSKERCSWPGVAPPNRISSDQLWPAPSVSNAATVHSSWVKEELDSCSSIRCSFGDEVSVAEEAALAASHPCYQQQPAGLNPARTQIDQGAVAVAAVQCVTVTLAVLAAMKVQAVNGKLKMCSITLWDQVLQHVLLPCVMVWGPSSLTEWCAARRVYHVACATLCIRAAGCCLPVLLMGGVEQTARLVAVCVCAASCLVLLPPAGKGLTAGALFTLLISCMQLMQVAGAGVLSALCTACVIAASDASVRWALNRPGVAA